MACIACAAFGIGNAQLGIDSINKSVRFLGHDAIFNKVKYSGKLIRRRRKDRRQQRSNLRTLRPGEVQLGHSEQGSQHGDDEFFGGTGAAAAYIC